MIIREFRGITDLVIAEVTEDTVENFTTGTPEEFAGASGAIKNDRKQVSETHYYNNIPAICNWEEQERIQLQFQLLLFLWICLQKSQVNITMKQQVWW